MSMTPRERAAVSALAAASSAVTRAVDLHGLDRTRPESEIIDALARLDAAAAAVRANLSTPREWTEGTSTHTFTGHHR